jgi:hypothetical protein
VEKIPPARAASALRRSRDALGTESQWPELLESRHVFDEKADAMRELTQLLLYLLGAAFVFSLPVLGYKLLLHDLPVAPAAATTAGATAPQNPAVEEDAPAPATRPVWIVPTAQYDDRPPMQYRPPVPAAEPKAARRDQVRKRKAATRPHAARPMQVDATAAQAYGSAEPLPPPRAQSVLTREEDR